MDRDINNYKVTREKLTTEAEVEKFLGGLYSRDTKIVDVQSYRYQASTGDFIHATYTPSAYKKYYTDTNGRVISKSTQPFAKYGADNKFPFFLYDLVTKSAVHKRTTKNISNIAYGRGLFPCNARSQDFYRWVKSNISTKTLKNIFDNVCIYGGAFVNLNFEGDGPQTELSSLTVDQFYNWRVGTPEEDLSNMGEILYHWHHPNYNSNKITNKYLRGIPVFKNIEDVQKNRYKVVGRDKTKPYYKRSSLNKNLWVSLIGEPETESEFYPTPSYLSDTFIDACMVDAALSSFDIAGLKNGLSAGYIITVPISGIDKLKKSDPEGYKKILADVKEKTVRELEGDENNAVSVVVVQDMPTGSDVPVAIDIKEIPHTNTGDIHKIIEERKNRNLLTAWGVLDSRIVGIPAMSGTGFASQAELFKVASQLFYDQVVFPEIVDPVEEWINTVLVDIWATEKNIQVLELIDETQPPIGVKFQRTRSFTITPDASMLEKYFLLDEIRDLLGAPTLSESDLSLLDDQKKERALLKFLEKSGTATGSGNLLRSTEPNDNDNDGANIEFMQKVAKACNITLVDLIKAIE